MKKSYLFQGHFIVVALLVLIDCKASAPLNVNDSVRSEIQAPSTHILPCSRLLQAAIDLDTWIFRGQGVSAAIIIKDHEYWTGTSGYSEPGKPVDVDMLLNIGSIGKNFLATLILQLSEEGKLSLDDPVAKWGLGSSSIDENITIRQLLNHTSGIFDWVSHHQSPYLIPYRQIDYEKEWTQDEILIQLGGKPYFTPGNSWHYSTTNYNLLKIIAEKTTGTTVSSEIQKRFLQPLGLDHTIAVDVGIQIPPHLDIAHSWFDANGDGEPEDISGDSQNWITSMSPNMMYASAIDLARWSQALYEGRVLSKASLSQMLDFHRPTPGEPPVTGCGLGTVEIAIKGLIQIYGHLGLHYGNMSAMLYLPKFRTSIVVLTNGNNQPFQYVISLNLLTAILLIKMRYFLYVAVTVILIFVMWRSWKYIFRRQEK
jgi:D-alanyl-D-alanine carboxypeptidase